VKSAKASQLVSLSYPEHEEGDGRQRLSPAHLLRNRLADYVLTHVGAVPLQWAYVSKIQLIILPYENSLLTCKQRRS
jgi:hypothetical protein